MEADDLHIDPGSHTPIVQQIIDQVQAAIECGRLREGASLPSVRAVATSHRVHAMTVSTAYQRLAAMGLLERRRGTVLRVRSVPVLSATERLTRLDEALIRALRIAQDLGVEPAAVLVRVSELLDSSARQVQQPSSASCSRSAQEP